MIENITPKLSKKPIKIIGCGLAGAEVAFILANNGFDVHIFDNGKNKPSQRFSYYDDYQNFMLENMKFELECLNSPLFSIAKKYNYTDFGMIYNEDFMQTVRNELLANNRIKIFDGNIDNLNDTETTVIATGHNTDKAFLNDIERIIGEMHLCFYQPVKMVIDANSVDFDKLNFVSETECYANMTAEEYHKLYLLITKFDKEYNKPEEFETEKQITVESLARRGEGGIRNAVLRPRFDDKCRPYASLRMTYNKFKNVLVVEDLYSALDEEEQNQLIDCFECLKGAKILRFCNVARRTFLLSPACLNDNLQLQKNENLYVCGGFSGTAGSFEGLLLANLCAYTLICNQSGHCGADLLKQNTCIGKIINNLIGKSVIKFRLFNLKYDIIDCEDLKKYDSEVETQKKLSKIQIEKFKEKFYGKYF